MSLTERIKFSNKKMLQQAFLSLTKLDNQSHYDSTQVAYWRFILQKLQLITIDIITEGILKSYLKWQAERLGQRDLEVY